jgi:DNA topoisomerase I
LADTIVKCSVCTRKVSNNQDKYCLYHKQAYDNLIKHYKIWNKAFGGLSWTNYMNKLLTLKETGGWVKEVINAELKTAT